MLSGFELYPRWVPLEHLQRQQFSFTKTNEYLSVSKNPQVFTSKLKDYVYVLSRLFSGVCFFQR